MASVLSVSANLKTVIITGLTASGKSCLAIKYAQCLRENFGIEAEIINADSVQLYNELKILTDCPECGLFGQINHHLYGILSPHDNSSVAIWCKLANEKINKLHKENKVAIICGGTGLYIKSLINGISNIPEIPQDFRCGVQKKFQELGRDEFFYQLSILDPVSYKTLHKNNTQRILRAYEVASYTGNTISEWWETERLSEILNEFMLVVLMPSRDKINKKCLVRLHKMIRNGAVEEVEEFIKKHPNYSGVLCNVIGYHEIVSFLNRSISFDECINLMHVKTRQYAKKQSTWFKNQLEQSKVMYEFGEEIVCCVPDNLLEANSKNS